MTVESEPIVPDKIVTPEQKEANNEAAALEDLFLIGSTKSNVFTIYKDDEGRQITVQFRSLQPVEIMEVAEAADRHSSSIARYTIEELETLARAIMYVNGMPLILNEKEREDYFKTKKKYPSPTEMARIILYEKIKSPHILDAMYEAYTDFIKGIQLGFDEVKKKLMNQESSNSTSPS
jgi:hypothetical protein